MKLPLQIISMKAENCSFEIENDEISKEYILEDLKKIADTTHKNCSYS